MEKSQKIASAIDLEQFNFGHSYVFSDFIYKSNVEAGQNIEEIAIHYDINIVECSWEGKPGVMIMLTDVTDKIKCKMMQEAQVYKDQMLAQITHDLRTPLNGIICSLQSSCNFKSVQEYQQCVDLSLKSAHLLLSVINDILDHSQMIKGKLRLVPSRFNLKNLLDDVVELMKPQAMKKQIDLFWEYQKFSLVSSKQMGKSLCDIQIHNDQNRIQQILLNLLGNALKYTFQGSIKIVVQDILQSQDEIEQYYTPTYKLSIIDTGVGVPEHLKNKIFDIYGTYDHSQGTNKHGIGLGLTICKQLAGQIGPKSMIGLQTQINEGSTFSFEIYQDLQIEDECINQKQQNSLTGSPLSFQIQACCSTFSENFNKNIDVSQIDYINVNQESDEEDEGFNEKLKSDSPIGLLVESKSKKKKQTLNNILKNKLISKLSNKNQCIVTRPKAYTSLLDKTSTIKNQIQDMIPKDKLTILIVDDNSFNILGIENLFKHILNIQFEYAFNGKQAVEKVNKNFEKCKKERYFLIFMDVNMPIMDGNQAIKIIRQIYNDDNPYKIISLTALGQIQDREKCFNSGADYFMNKPLTYQNIKNMLEAMNIGITNKN